MTASAISTPHRAGGVIPCLVGERQPTPPADEDISLQSTKLSKADD